MKIAIFGDSFADPYNNSIEAVSWTKLLKEKSNDYEITNFAKGGTSLWWSYELFLENYQKFDTIIFVVTDAGRLSNLIYDEGINCYDTAIELEEKIKNNHSNNLNDPKIQHNLKLLESVKDYYLCFQNYKQEKFLHKKIIGDLVKKVDEVNDKKIILIPGCLNSIPLTNTFYFKNFLHDISMKEIYVNTGIRGYIIETNYRANHMSKENNEILAEKVHQIIQGTCVQVTIDDFIFQKYPNPEKYWNI